MKLIGKVIIFAAMLALAVAGPGFSKSQPKPKVAQVTFMGNDSYAESRLESLMLTRPSRFLATSRFHPDVFQDDLATLISFYRQNGFLQALISDTSVVFDSLNNQVDIAIRIEEGNRTYVEGVTIFGNDFIVDSAVMQKINIRKSDPLRRPLIEDAVISMLSLYAEHGFLDATVTPQVQINDTMHLALIDFACHEGLSSQVGRIELSGGEKTRSNVILRELSFHVGDTVKFSELLRSQRRLYLTGLFESVFVRPLPLDLGDSNERTILIEIKEIPSTELSFSIGYGTVGRVRGRIELNNLNLAGSARKAGIRLEANFIKQGVSLSFSEPWTLGTRWKTDFSVFGILKQEPAYHSESIGGKLTFGHKLGRYTNISTSYRHENTNISQIDLSVPLDETDPQIRSLTLNISYDNRDNLFDPSTGWYANWSNEIAGSFLQGSDTFAKSVVNVKRFHPLGRNTVVGSAIELGWMDAFGKSEEIPINERFYAGGPTSLRGFGYQMVGPLDSNGQPIGGQFKLIWNLFELRKSVYRMMGMVLFVDAGNVWQRLEDVRISDVRVNIGTGLRANSPLGILRLDCGINLDRQSSEPGVKIFFSVGQAF
ncbi:MAG: outer membrane protein assembly factor BamA [Candidatus Zixiibacteriota bacterium]